MPVFYGSRYSHLVIVVCGRSGKVITVKFSICENCTVLAIIFRSRSGIHQQTEVTVQLINMIDSSNVDRSCPRIDCQVSESNVRKWGIKGEGHRACAFQQHRCQVKCDDDEVHLRALAAAPAAAYDVTYPHHNNDAMTSSRSATFRRKRFLQ